MSKNMYSAKLGLIRKKIEGLMTRNLALQSENENLLEKIRVLEQKINIENSGTNRLDKKPERVQQAEKSDAPTLFDPVDTKELKEKIEACMEDVNQCIEIIEKK